MCAGWRERLLCAALTLLLSACGVAPRQAPVSGPGADAVCASVLLVKRGWHTDIGLPAQQLGGASASLLKDFPGARYLLFGFGDRHYVLARDKNFGELARALWPGPGLMLVTGLTTSPAQAFGDGQVLALTVSQPQAAAVLDFIWQSMQGAAAGGVSRYGDGPYGGSLYYPSSRTYAGFYTCNTWAADGLRAGGLKLSADGVLFAGQVWARARRARDGLPACRPSAAPVALIIRTGRARAFGY